MCYFLLLFIFFGELKSSSDVDVNNKPKPLPPMHIVIYQGGINQSFDATKNTMETFYEDPFKSGNNDEIEKSNHSSNIIKGLVLAYNNWKPFLVGFLAGHFKGQMIKLAAVSSIAFFFFCKKVYRQIKDEGIGSGFSYITRIFI